MPPLTRPRLTVDADRLVLAVQRQSLPSGVTVQKTRTDDFLNHLPWVQPHTVGGPAQGRMLRFRTTAGIAVEVWHHSAREAADLADLVVQAFQHAWESGVVIADDDGPIGGLARFEVTSPFTEIRDAGQLGRVAHYSGDVGVTLRPPPA